MITERRRASLYLSGENAHAINYLEEAPQLAEEISIQDFLYNLLRGDLMGLRKPLF
jgi:hypothetical protein